jgi:HD domain
LMLMLRLSRMRLLTPYCVVLGSGAVALAIALVVVGPLPALVPVLLLGGLFAISEHIIVVLPNSSSVSASFMLTMASVVVFRGQAAYLGPLLVGMCGGLYWPHLRAGDWRKISFNVGNFGLASLAAAAMYGLLAPLFGESVPAHLVTAVPACVAYAVVNLTALGVLVILKDGLTAREAIGDVAFGERDLFVFAILGVFLGQLYLAWGAVVVPLFVAPILVARQAFASALELESSHDAALATLTSALEAKDRYTAGHVERVARFANYVGLELHFRPRRLQKLRFAALMHDVGKLVVPNRLLNKPGRLTAAEFLLVKQHERISRDLLASIEFLTPLAPLAVGEPGSEHDVSRHRPGELQIIDVADAFDAMTSTRSYRKALSQEVAFAELRAEAGRQFHPRCVEALIHAIERRGEHYGGGYEANVVNWRVPPPAVGTGSAGLGDLAPDQSWSA